MFLWIIIILFYRSDIPSEYKLPTKNSDVNMHSRHHDLFSVNPPTVNNDVNMHNFGHDDFFEDTGIIYSSSWVIIILFYVINNVLQFTDSFENNLNKLFNVSFEELLRQFETEFFNNNENINNSIFIGKFLWYYIAFLSAIFF